MTEADGLVPVGAQSSPLDVVLYAPAGYADIQIEGPANLVRYGDVPPVAAMTAADIVVVLGQLQSGDAGLEMAGRARLALEAGATVVFCYAARLSDVEWQIVREFIPSLQSYVLGGQLRTIASDPGPHPAFRVYLVQYGQTDQAFLDLPADTEVLAHTGPEPVPCAFLLRVGRGRLYVLPIHTASGAIDPFNRLLEAVLEHRDETTAEVPAFLDALELPGEAGLRAQIVEATSLLEQLNGKQHELTQHKRLLAHLDGTPLEQLVIDELNFVLEGGPLLARDTIERFAEDFAFVDEGGVLRAIGEAKAISRHVGFSHVDQLNWHRTQLLAAVEDDGDGENDRDPGPPPAVTPGVLVANVFRNEEHLTRRLGERVSGPIAAHARRSNVLILRTADLLQLVARRLDARDAAELADLILQGGGGWLEVSEDDLTLHAD